MQFHVQGIQNEIAEMARKGKFRHWASSFDCELNDAYVSN